jgi:hypothetical protein
MHTWFSAQKVFLPEQPVPQRLSPGERHRGEKDLRSGGTPRAQALKKLRGWRACKQ